ncbi:Hypothetical predicted protein [Xyrichtys novacula]|uniref:Uncharacterized protein n=1 Tax=Xyrichtys novacula TaxID=13765 RepID=A0AAV1F1G3_XYRNO|nr:Hypothetical predicted protein [Xyrichtys novacula]
MGSSEIPNTPCWSLLIYLVYRINMDFTIESFIENPTKEALNICKKAELKTPYFGITVSAGSREDAVKQTAVTGLLEKQILANDPEAKAKGTDEEDNSEEGVRDSAAHVGLTQLEPKLKVKQIKYEQMRMKLTFQEKQS